MAVKRGQSPSRPAVGSPSRRVRGGPEAGFTLVEVLFSTVILVVGLSFVAQLLAVTLRAESMARHGAEATRLAQGKLDELMKANFDTSPSVQITTGTDPLATNVANYFDTPAANTIVRWRVDPGPAGTRILTVRVLIANGTTTMRIIDLTTLLRRW